MKKNYYILAFNSTHDAICAEKALENRLPVQVIPTLRVVSESCGISLRIEEEHFPILEPLLQAQVIEEGRYALYHISPDPAGAGLAARRM